MATLRALTAVRGASEREVTASRAAWGLIANGLPSSTALARAPVATAAASAASIHTPLLLQETTAASLTGPAAELAGNFRSYALLSRSGWKGVAAAIEAIEHGSPQSARFARANAALYIESVYDAQFTLAQLGKELLAGYHKLGAARAFNGALREGEVDSLAHAYSEAHDRLHPHAGVRLGS